jgi:hypothetical protein
MASRPERRKAWTPFSEMEGYFYLTAGGKSGACFAVEKAVAQRRREVSPFFSLCAYELKFQVAG